MLILGFWGCASNPEGNSSGPVSQGIRSPVTASPNAVVGAVRWADPVSREAVVRLFDESPPPGEFLVARDESLESTAVLSPTDIRRGRTLGVRIISGLPAPGDIVVSPGPKLREEIEASLEDAPGN